jgi:hypothetical protein
MVFFSRKESDKTEFAKPETILYLKKENVFISNLPVP